MTPLPQSGFDHRFVDRNQPDRKMWDRKIRPIFFCPTFFCPSPETMIRVRLGSCRVTGYFNYQDQKSLTPAQEVQRMKDWFECRGRQLSDPESKWSSSRLRY